MTEEKLFSCLCRYVCDNILTFEERRSMGLDAFHKFVRENYTPIPKDKLIVGREYCGNLGRAVWNGERFECGPGKTHYHYSDEGDYVPVLMSLDEFKTSILNLAEERPKCWRYGQAVFNGVEELYGDIARIAQFKYGVDCFYDDDKVQEFINKCYEVYGNSFLH